MTSDVLYARKEIVFSHYVLFKLVATSINSKGMILSSTY